MHLFKALALALCLRYQEWGGGGVNPPVFPEIKVLSLGKHWRLLWSFSQKILRPHPPFIGFLASGFLYFLPSFFLRIIVLPDNCA